MTQHSLNSLIILLGYCFFAALILTIPTHQITIWIYIEVLSIFFLCFILSQSNPQSYGSNIVYFLIQASISIGILVSILYTHNIESLLVLLFILANLGFFPLSFLYLFSIASIESTVLFLSLTVQNLPPFLLLNIQYQSTNPQTITIIAIIILSVSLFISSMGLSTNPLRESILVSSLFNSSWIALACFSSFYLFLAYILIYSICLYFLIFNNTLPIPFLTLIGLPPLPLFFINLLIVYQITTTSPLIYPTAIVFISSLCILTIYFNQVNSSIGN